LVSASDAKLRTALSRHARPRPLLLGEVVLGQESSGVSIFALQFAKLAGARVIATTSEEAKADALYDRRKRAAVIRELLGAVLDTDAGALADVLVVGALVRVLESAPAADVVDQDGGEVGIAALDVIDQRLERIATVQAEPALALIGVGANDREAASIGIPADGIGLVLGRVLLMLGRHSHILRGLAASGAIR
jgi:NADPH:quinone reductase-like Zn-dependent oxidoreductase